MQANMFRSDLWAVEMACLADQWWHDTKSSAKQRQHLPHNQTDLRAVFSKANTGLSIVSLVWPWSSLYIYLPPSDSPQIEWDLDFAIYSLFSLTNCTMTTAHVAQRGKAKFRIYATINENCMPRDRYRPFAGRLWYGQWVYERPRSTPEYAPGEDPSTQLQNMLMAWSYAQHMVSKG